MAYYPIYFCCPWFPRCWCRSSHGIFAPWIIRPPQGLPTNNQIFKSQNSQEKKYIPIENVQENLDLWNNKIQPCRKNCGYTIEFGNHNQIDTNWDPSYEDISNYFKKFGIINQILEYDGLFSVDFRRRVSVNTILNLRKIPHYIKCGNNGDTFIEIDIFRQPTNNHLKDCNYEIRDGDKPIDGK